MSYATRRAAWAALVLVLAGCASGGGGTSSDAGAATRVRTDMIMPDELQRGQWSSAEDAVRALRPQWLVPRTNDRLSGEVARVQVRVDETFVGDVSALRMVPASDVAIMQLVDGLTAAGRWGGRYANGVIQVTTRRR